MVELVGYCDGVSVISNTPPRDGWIGETPTETAVAGAGVDIVRGSPGAGGRKAIPGGGRLGEPSLMAPTSGDGLNGRVLRGDAARKM